MKTEHIVKSFDAELTSLDNMIIEMGGLAETQLAGAIDAMVKRDVTRAAEIRESDLQIDALESEIDQLAIKLIALRQPLAQDLRVVVAALKIASKLERIGDYAKNIAKRTVALAEAPNMGGATITIVRMGQLVQVMIKNVLDAYIARDVQKANDVLARDFEVDQLNTSLFRELLTYMMEDPRNITSCTHLLFVAKNVERIGDHATSIAEQVHFIVHGALPSDERRSQDTSSYTTVTPNIDAR
jgi:phosphate transport system protein